MPMSRNFIIIAVVGALIIVLGAGYFFFSRSAAPAALPAPGNTGSLPPSAGESEQPPAANYPTSATISIGTPKGVVTVKNFYPTMLGADEGLVVLADNDQYDLKYDPSTGEFGMYLFTGPFEATRAAAEADLLAKLGLGKGAACRLTVRERVSRSVSTAFAGKTLALSFCGGGVQ